MVLVRRTHTSWYYIGFQDKGESGCPDRLHPLEYKLNIDIEILKLYPNDLIGDGR